MLVLLAQIAAGLVIGAGLLIGVVVISLRAGDKPMRKREGLYDDTTALTGYTPPDDGGGGSGW